MSDWKNVQYKDGKMRTSEGGGGGGSSTFAGLDDVNFSNLQNGQVPKYNSTTHKWENANESGGGGNVDDVEVNGVSVVDAQKVAKITSYKEVTLAEYQALPSSKTSDGVLYCISDVGGADGFPPLIYSDEEREIGVWVDGKPLYQKTIDFGALPNNTSKSVNHNIANVDLIVDVKGVAISSTQNYNSFNMTFIISSSYASLTANRESIVIESNTAWSSYGFNYCKVTLQYTKTTDTAGSGTWTTQGGYAHHYSTTEHIIGTYIDGSPIYEITIPAFTFSSGQTTVTHNLNIDAYLSITGWVCVNNDMTQKFAFPFVQNRWGGYCQPIQESANFIIIDASWSNNKAELTIQYTKKTT